MKDDLRTFLLSQSTVTAYTTNLYTSVAPDNLQEDHIRIQKMTADNGPWYFDDKKDNSELWQIDIFSLNSETPDALGTIIVDLLNGYDGVMGGSTITLSRAHGPVFAPDMTDPTWTHGIVTWEVDYQR